MKTLSERLAAAVEYHRRGRLTQAERMYRAVLKSRPEHADALHLLGLIASETGCHQEAVTLIGRAIRQNPAVPAYHKNLGRALARQGDALCQAGRFEEAEQAWREAVRLKPDLAAAWVSLAGVLARGERWQEASEAWRRALDADPTDGQAWLELGNALQRLGRFKEAETAYWQAVQRLPDSAEAHCQLGNVFYHLGQYDEAETAYRKTLSLEAGRAEVHYNLGGSLQAMKDHDAAIACYREAIRLTPDYADAHNNLGTSLQALGRLEEAAACYREALRLKPAYQEARYNLGLNLQEQHRFAEALACYDEVVLTRPDYDEAVTNRGNTLLALGRLNEALACYQDTLARQPDHIEANWNLGFVSLLLGDFERGWKGYEWRKRQKNHIPRPDSRPVWDGSPAPDKTILVYAEQGLGDTIQFVRFAPLARSRCARLVLECQPRLKPLLEGVAGVDHLAASGEPLPDYDCQVSLMSLPAALGTTLATLPAATPYLAADPESVERWKRRMEDRGGLKVGLAWAGNANNKNDWGRSLPLEALAPLGQVDGVRCYCLQRGPAAGQLASPPTGLKIERLEEESSTVVDTAAIIANLDLVISVDTMTAHLAGALGRPVWVLLSYSPDWRWLAGRDDSPWYPTMRLFRQPAPGDWGAAVENARRALEELASAVEAPRQGR